MEQSLFISSTDSLGETIFHIFLILCKCLFLQVHISKHNIKTHLPNLNKNTLNQICKLTCFGS